MTKTETIERVVTKRAGRQHAEFCQGGRVLCSTIICEEGPLVWLRGSYMTPEEASTLVISLHMAIDWAENLRKAQS